jgi:hypothetical protein
VENREAVCRLQNFLRSECLNSPRLWFYGGIHEMGAGVPVAGGTITRASPISCQHLTRQIHFGLELSVIAAIGGHATQFIARDPERPAWVELIFSLQLLAPGLADVGRKGEQEILGNALL